jgi:hypothetical protein
MNEMKKDADKPITSPIALFLCNRTDTIATPWRDAGYDCWMVDTQHARGDNRGTDGIMRIGADVSRWLPPRGEYAIVVAFPPCTHLAISGARWFGDKGLGALAEGLEIVEACRRICEWSGAPWALENPVGTLSTYWRKPDHIFDPCDFGGYEGGSSDTYTKRTCLWTGGGFRMPEARPIEPTEGSRMHFLAPGPNRGDKRAETPAGFARAIFEANVNSSREQAA